MPYFVVNDHCNGCLACVENCPSGALDAQIRENELTLRHNMAKCARCATCWRVCPQDAVEFHRLLENCWEEVITFEYDACSICGEPVLTRQFDRGLLPVSDQAGLLCEYHRAKASAKTRVFQFTEKTDATRKPSDDRR